jgi:hypothetical protein
MTLRIVVPAVAVAAALAGWFTYLVTPPPAPPLEADQRLPPTLPNVKGPYTGTPVNIDQHLTPEEQAAAAFNRASKIILRQLPDAQASARINELPILGHVPLPKRRPMPSAAAP